MAEQTILELLLKANTKQAEQALDDVEKKGKQAGNSISASFKGAAKAIVGLFAVKQLAGFITDAVQTAAKFEDAMLKAGSAATLTGQSVDKVKKAVLDLSQDGVIGVDKVAQSLQQLLNLGLKTDEAISFIEAGKRVAVFEGTMSTAEESLTSFIRGIQTGSAELLENLSPQIRAVIKDLGGFAKVSEDAAARQKLVNAVIERGAQFNEQYDMSLQTTGAQITKLQKNWEKFLATIGNSKFFNLILDNLNLLVEGLQTVASAIQTIFNKINEGLGGDVSNERATEIIKENIDRIKEIKAEEVSIGKTIQALSQQGFSMQNRRKIKEYTDDLLALGIEQQKLLKQNKELEEQLNKSTSTSGGIKPKPGGGGIVTKETKSLSRQILSDTQELIFLNKRLIKDADQWNKIVTDTAEKYGISKREAEAVLRAQMKIAEVSARASGAAGFFGGASSIIQATRQGGVAGAASGFGGAGQTIAGAGQFIGGAPGGILQAVGGTLGPIGGVIGSIGSIFSSIFDNTEELRRQEELRQNQIRLTNQLLETELNLQRSLVEAARDRQRLIDETTERQKLLNEITISDPVERRQANLQLEKQQATQIAGDLGITGTFEQVSSEIVGGFEQAQSELIASNVVLGFIRDAVKIFNPAIPLESIQAMSNAVRGAATTLPIGDLGPETLAVWQEFAQRTEANRNTIEAWAADRDPFGPGAPDIVVEGQTTRQLEDLISAAEFDQERRDAFLRVAAGIAGQERDFTGGGGVDLLQQRESSFVNIGRGGVREAFGVFTAPTVNPAALDLPSGVGTVAAATADTKSFQERQTDSLDDLVNLARAQLRQLVEINEKTASAAVISEGEIDTIIADTLDRIRERQIAI